MEASSMSAPTDHEDLLRRVVRLAAENVAVGGGPFAALVVRDGVVVGEGVNRVAASRDSTAHAEILAIRAACEALGTHELRDCDLVVNAEPCPMCLGAAYWARIRSVWFAAPRSAAAEAGFDDALVYEEIPRAPEDRRIPCRLKSVEGADDPFRLWTKHPGRIDY
jgi:guanine deaminase